MRGPEAVSEPSCQTRLHWPYELTDQGRKRGKKVLGYEESFRLAKGFRLTKAYPTNTEVAIFPVDSKQLEQNVSPDGSFPSTMSTSRFYMRSQERLDRMVPLW